MDPTPFVLRTEFITLDALLKACGAAASGGAAKQLIDSGGVQVNGQSEIRRGRKLRPGDSVAAGSLRIVVRAAADDPEAAG